MKQRLWWVLIPTIVTAVATATLSYFFMPPRYRSETVIIAVPQRVPRDVVRPSIDTQLSDRLASLRQQILSRTRLERIIKDFDLYPSDRSNRPAEAVVAQMRDDISLTVDSREVGDDHLGTVRVAFRAANPRTAMRVTERLAALFIDESLKDREVLAEGTKQFLAAQIEDARRQIIEKEAELAILRTKAHGELSQADLLPYEVLKETYKALLIKEQDAKIAANLERRQIGEQFKLLDPARLPEVPVGPSRTLVNFGGALAGLAFGLVIVGVAKRQKT